MSVGLLGLALPHVLFAEGKTLSLVATTGMIADTARTVGGDLVDVRALMGPGVDPHAYRQTRTDIVAMVRADLVLWNGLYLEAQMEEFFQDLMRRTTVVAVGEAVSVTDRIAHDSYTNRFDPHLWMDPLQWRTVSGAIRDAMIEAAPVHAEIFSENAVAYAGRIDALVAYSTAVLSSVPKDKRVLVTAHDAFNYFGRAHNFEVIGIQGISTESEAGLNRIA